MIACFTPTKNRPQQFALVIDCMNRQTKQPDLWMIVEDGQPAIAPLLSKIKCPHTYINWKCPLQYSVTPNSLLALQNLTADLYVMIQDDDYYPDTYLEHISSLHIQPNQMIGNGRWPDYRLSTGYYRVRNKMQGKELKASGDTFSQWHQSAFKGQSLKAVMMDVMRARYNDLYPDVQIYRHLFQQGHYSCILYDFGRHSCISLKDYGVGTPGVIASHRSNKDLIQDVQFKWFKEHVPHWKSYEKYLGISHE